jgi:hypothetical protein
MRTNCSIERFQDADSPNSSRHRFCPRRPEGKNRRPLLKPYALIEGFLGLDELVGLMPGTLRDGLKEFPDYCKMVVIVFGDEIQMVHKSHRLLQTRMSNGLSK